MELVVMDLGSSCGTRVDGQSIAPNVPIALGNGQQLTFGASSVIYLVTGLRGAPMHLKMDSADPVVMADNTTPAPETAVAMSNPVRFLPDHSLTMPPEVSMVDLSNGARAASGPEVTAVLGSVSVDPRGTRAPEQLHVGRVPAAARGEMDAQV
eukprot:2212738-Rhodomonas_salina.1